MVSITDLPVELLWQIAENLRSRDQGRLRRASRFFEDRIAVLLFKQVSFNLNYKGMTKMVFIGNHVKIRQHVRVLTLDNQAVLPDMFGFDEWKSYWNWCDGWCLHSRGNLSAEMRRQPDHSSQWKSFEQYRKEASFLRNVCKEIHHDLIYHDDILGIKSECTRPNSDARSILGGLKQVISALQGLLDFRFEREIGIDDAPKLWKEYCRPEHNNSGGILRRAARMENLFLWYMLACLNARPRSKPPLKRLCFDHKGVGPLCSDRALLLLDSLEVECGQCFPIYAPRSVTPFGQLFRQLTDIEFRIQTGPTYDSASDGDYTYNLAFLRDCHSIRKVTLEMRFSPQFGSSCVDRVRLCLEQLSKPGTWPQIEYLTLGFHVRHDDLLVFLQTFSSSLKNLDCRAVKIRTNNWNPETPTYVQTKTLGSLFSTHPNLKMIETCEINQSMLWPWEGLLRDGSTKTFDDYSPRFEVDRQETPPVPH